MPSRRNPRVPPSVWQNRRHISCCSYRFIGFHEDRIFTANSTQELGMSDARSGNSRNSGNKQSHGSGNGRRNQSQSSRRQSNPEAYRSEASHSPEQTQNVGEGERLISLA